MKIDEENQSVRGKIISNFVWAIFFTKNKEFNTSQSSQ